jgi:AmiR/NasT family two-component response regulator
MVQRVFIVWSYSLFCDTVRAVLNHPQIEVVGQTSDQESIQARVAALQPDIVIIEDTGEGLAISARALQILEDNSGKPRVFRMSLEDNELRVFSEERVILSQVEDLRKLILQA